MPPRRKAATKTEPSKSTKGTSKALEDQDIDPSLLTVAKLRIALEEKGLDTSGKKPQLVERLKAALGDEDGDEDASAPKKKKTKKSEPEQSEFQKAKEILQEQDAKKTKKKSHSQRKVDQQVPSHSIYNVVDDWDCMLNQTNVGHNNNKYYVIQMLKAGLSYYVWNRWGRVGENGQNAMKGPFPAQSSAETEFMKKFKDKTKNNWNERDNFVPVSGKYDLLEMADSDEEEIVVPVDPKSDEKPKKVKACTLDKETQGLIKLIFDNDMFNNAMKSFDIDVKKMPLGKLSKSQIAKGFDVLERLEAELKANKTGKLSDLSSEFYTVIPHDFGRQRPPTISSAENLQQKKDMLMVLGDIELALSMQKDKDKTNESLDEVPHPYDVNMGLLKTDIELIDSKSDLYKTLETYTNNTKSGGASWFGGNCQIQNIWKINRRSEFDRHKVHDNIKNRKLLWHGTNVAVVAAILKDGLRIMPHSGGRVGRGIYFASEQMKSAGYVSPAANRIGIMFLNEVALGEEHGITVDDSSLKKAPAGYDSVVARGRTEPDSKLDTKIKLDGRDVIVPQGKAVNQSKYSSSSFSQSEYLVYKESQNRIRFLLTFKM